MLVRWLTARKFHDEDISVKAVGWFVSADGRGFDRVNEAFITLLPKRDGAVDIGDFRPISLIHSLAKIISKAMASRLSKPLLELVDHNQSAFVKGRSIQDNFFMTNNSIKALHKRRVPALMLKLDIAKAFDSVAWPFLFEVLRHRGFGPHFLARVALMLSSSSTSVLINGILGDQFWYARGLRQGDPSSPMFFILVMDVLNAVFKLAEEEGVFSLLLPWGIKHRLSLFADDVVLMIRPTVGEATAVVEHLAAFGAASGLKCNLTKSSVSPIRCEGIDLKPILAALDCTRKDFPI
jgi:hypothetical protein